MSYNIQRKQLQTPLSASYAESASHLIGGATFNTGSVVTTSSFNNFTGSYTTGSFTGSFTGLLFGTASFATTASYIPTLRATGSNTQIQFNDNGLLGSSPNFLFQNNNIHISGSNVFMNPGYSAGGTIGSLYPDQFGLYDVGDIPIALYDNTDQSYKYGDGNYTISGSKHIFSYYPISASAGVATSLLTLTPTHPLPVAPQTGTFMVSASSPPKPYFWDGSVWNPLY